MLRRLVFLLGLLALVACGIPGPRVPPRPEPGSVADLTSKTVALVVKKPGNKLKAYCSGVWVSMKSILTAQHCLLTEEDLGYVTRDGVLDQSGDERWDPEVLTAKVVAQDEAHDLALLEATGQTYPHEVAEVALGNPAQGQPVATMGHPFGLWFSYSAGHVSAVRVMSLEPTALYVQTTAPTSRGNSGCGLFNTRGELVGVAHAGIPSGSNLAFYVHAKHVEAFLAKYLPKGK